MQIGEIKSVTYWRKTFSVEAVRLTTDNMQQLADFLGASHITKHKKNADEFYIDYGGDEGYAGEWLVRNEDNYYFLGDEEFLKAYRTHSEQESEEARYAKVFQLVISAMNKQSSATYNGDQNGMDLVAIETTKKILKEL